MSESGLPRLASIAERLGFATRDERVKTAVITAIGRNPVTLKRYVEGVSKIPAEVVAVVAEHSNLSADWLLTGLVPNTSVAALNEDVVFVPRLEVRASAGRGRAVVPGDGEAEGFAFQRAWLRSLNIAPGNAEFVLAAGDSMEPTIKDGDMMLVDRGYGDVVNGKIYVLVVNGLVVVKRINVLTFGGLMLISDNERYPTETIAAEAVNDLNIEARVAWYGRVV